MKVEGVSSRLHIVRSDGGLMSAEAASERPVHTVLSGPAGGVTATVMVARRANIPKLIAFDMGGTSTDVSVVIDGQPTISRSTEVGAFPAKVPTLEVRSVGAGGGSIAEVSDLTKSLRVGPRSAGARPGPVAYGRGGTEPTVSDANIVLGYLPPVLLGGDMKLDVAAARAAISKIGASMGLSTEGAAKGIIDIANEVMLGALRVITVQRGLDPRDFGILAFGGAGPVHANALAELLGCYPVIVPANPGVLSALGFLEADFKNEFVQTFIRSTVGLSPDDVWGRFASLRKKAVEWLDDEGVAQKDRGIAYSVDLRYEQQGFEVTIPVTERSTTAGGDLSSIIADFHKRHAAPSTASVSPCPLNSSRCASWLPARRRRCTKRRLRHLRQTLGRQSWRRARPTLTAPGSTRQTTTAPNSASARRSPVRRSSANMTRPACCSPATSPKSTSTATS